MGRGGGREEAEIETEQEEWRRRDGKIQICMCKKKKKTPSSFSPFLSPADYIKIFSLLIHLFSARENLPKCHDKGGGGLWGRPEESFTRQAALIYDSRRLH